MAGPPAQPPEKAVAAKGLAKRMLGQPTGGQPTGRMRHGPRAKAQYPSLLTHPLLEFGRRLLPNDARNLGGGGLTINTTINTTFAPDTPSGFSAPYNLFPSQLP